MTKQELETLLDMTKKEKQSYENALFEIKKCMQSAADMFNSGLAEESDFNNGIQNALCVISEIINSHISSYSYLKCPKFKYTDDDKPAFTVIEGGLSKKKQEV